ncbi:MAG: amidase [Parasphingorhabdus sp.]
MQRPAIAFYLTILASALASHGVAGAADEVETKQANTSLAATGWAAKTLPEIAAALQSGELTSEEITSLYLERIARIDRSGPTLQAILTVNPDALAQARAADKSRKSGKILGPLHGVPVLLKDNIETKDAMPTTAGALALKDNVTGRDSPLAAGLRASGAIILGKTNLSQWANFRSSDSMSGWSALGGQVSNPHMLDRNPCGSSSGSGSAAAASLAAGAVGTETNGSIICPSSVNGVVGFKPSIGLVSQRYIIPISAAQDTAGPMTKTVTGAAMMLNAMATGAAKTDYVTGLNRDSLKNARIGVMRFTEASSADTKMLFDSALKDLEAAGATLIDIKEFEPSISDFRDKNRMALRYEFKAGLNDYLKNAAKSVQVRDLDELIAFNLEHADIELSLFDQSIFEASASTGELTDEVYVAARRDVNKAVREDGIDALLKTYNVDVLLTHSGIAASRIDPVHGDVWPHRGSGGWLAAIAGYPHITVPMGDVHGLPVGLSFMAAMDEDTKVLSFGYAYEQLTQHRVEPQFLKSAENRPEIGEAMKRREN